MEHVRGNPEKHAKRRSQGNMSATPRDSQKLAGRKKAKSTAPKSRPEYWRDRIEKDVTVKAGKRYERRRLLVSGSGSLEWEAVHLPSHIEQGDALDEGSEDLPLPPQERLGRDRRRIRAPQDHPGEVEDSAPNGRRVHPRGRVGLDGQPLHIPRIHSGPSAHRRGRP